MRFLKAWFHWEFSPVLRDTAPDFCPDASKRVFVIRSLVERISDKNYQMKEIGCDR